MNIKCLKCGNLNKDTTQTASCKKCGNNFVSGGWLIVPENTQNKNIVDNKEKIGLKNKTILKRGMFLMIFCAVLLILVTPLRLLAHQTINSNYIFGPTGIFFFFYFCLMYNGSKEYKMYLLISVALGVIIFYDFAHIIAFLGDSNYLATLYYFIILILDSLVLILLRFSEQIQYYLEYRSMNYLERERLLS